MFPYFPTLNPCKISLFFLDLSSPLMIRFCHWQPGSFLKLRRPRQRGASNSWGQRFCRLSVKNLKASKLFESQIRHELVCETSFIAHKPGQKPKKHLRTTKIIVSHPLTDPHWLVFLAAWFSRGSCDFCLKLPKTKGKKNKPMEVHEW